VRIKKNDTVLSPALNFGYGSKLDPSGRPGTYTYGLIEVS
jgi:hypothetical protein